ncbi:ion transporter [Persicitalea jodogahamensis]|uniref:Ion transporter n=1 Tax=Persicitalea jodogahamensis TaxID=402147 RepID=A0A8J3D2W5_9BACT|nr:ion transporter [Persicitalea jodogahamensis]GHB72662.1 ion transporter [Persicitalea jodogahamensis]
MNDERPIKKDWRYDLHEIIYEADTKAGKLFDVILLWLILFSVLLVMLESVEQLNDQYFEFFNIAEWVVTALFTIEYIARIITVRRPLSYIFSFYGLIDFLSTIPKYISLFLVGTQVLVAFRALRLLRIFRILKLHHYVGESQKITNALRASRTRILVFLFAILLICIVLGAVMYLVEDHESGFTSIPKSVYWAIVTLTTVGYGDIAPQSVTGQFIASLIMILGYAIIAIPTGIITSEMTKANAGEPALSTQNSCPNCSAEGHLYNAKYCYRCGTWLKDYENA